MIIEALRSLSPEGLQIFRRIFVRELPEEALDAHDDALSHPVPGTARLVLEPFKSARDLAQAVIDALGSRTVAELLPDTGLWAWLTFILRDQLFPRDASGQRKFGEIHRWYPSDPNDWQKGQRHLVRMPVHLLSTLGENADHLLCREPSVHSEIREQLTSQNDMFTSGFQRLARALYFDDQRSDLKRGAGGSGAGSPRRLAKVRQQLDVTWDLDDLDFERLLRMLPKEFDRFRPAS